MKGKGIERARDYLAKVVGVDFPDTPEWEKIKTYNKLRNFIVHNDGDIIDDSSDAKFLQEYITRNSHHLGIRYRNIEIKKGFCDEVIDTFEKFETQLTQLEDNRVT